jgi:hypothetical protein
MNSIRNFTLFSASFMFIFCANAADPKPVTPAASDGMGLITSFRCEKFSSSLGDLKLKMIETCNLDKPFSSSMTRTVGGEEVYMFCCHKAK